MCNVLNETVHRHVYAVNKQVFKKRRDARRNNERHATTITITPIGQ